MFPRSHREKKIIFFKFLGFGNREQTKYGFYKEHAQTYFLLGKLFFARRLLLTCFVQYVVRLMKQWLIIYANVLWLEMFGLWFGVAAEVWGSGTKFLPPCSTDGDKTYGDRNGALGNGCLVHLECEEPFSF